MKSLISFYKKITKNNLYLYFSNDLIEYLIHLKDSSKIDYWVYLPDNKYKIIMQFALLQGKYINDIRKNLDNLGYNYYINSVLMQEIGKCNNDIYIFTIKPVHN